jgi:two-component system, LytTR family, response regulator
VQESVHAARSSLGAADGESNRPCDGLADAERLYLRDGGRTLSIPVDEIHWVEAAGNYVQIHTARKTHLVRHTVKAMEAKLARASFLRVRPSAIVAVAYVEALAHRPGGDYVVILRDGTRIPSSRSFRPRLEEIFGKPSKRKRID